MIGAFLLALILCALVFGGLLHVAEGCLAGLDGEGLGALDALLRGLALAATVLVPLLWVRPWLQRLAAFCFGAAAGALATGPLFAGLAASGRIPHL